MVIRNLLSISFVILLSLLVISCRSAESNKEENASQKPDPQISIPSGNADVIVSIENQNEEGKNYKVTAKVGEVKGYGPSSPVIPPGSEIDILFPKHLMENDTSKIEKGKNISIRISYKQGLENSGNWFFVTFNN